MNKGVSRRLISIVAIPITYLVLRICCNYIIADSSGTIYEDIVPFIDVMIDIWGILCMLCCTRNIGLLVRDLKYADIQEEYAVDFDGEKRFTIKIPIDKNEVKTVTILKEDLPQKVQDELDKIQKCLMELYDRAISTKASYNTFTTYGSYLETLADELKDAVENISGDVTEEKFFENTETVYETIQLLQKNIDEDIKYEKDRKRFEEQLNADSYEPFSKLNELNKLIE